MAARLRTPLKAVKFNANCIWKRRYELSKQLQDLYIDMSLLWETHLKPHESFLITIIAFNGLTAFRGENVLPIAM
jgi:hypothetical protein